MWWGRRRRLKEKWVGIMDVRATKKVKHLKVDSWLSGCGEESAILCAYQWSW